MGRLRNKLFGEPCTDELILMASTTGDLEERIREAEEDGWERNGLPCGTNIYVPKAKRLDGTVAGPVMIYVALMVR